MFIGLYIIPYHTIPSAITCYQISPKTDFFAWGAITDESTAHVLYEYTYVSTYIVQCTCTYLVPTRTRTLFSLVWFRANDGMTNILRTV